MRIIRHNGQHDRLEGSEEGPASLEGSEALSGVRMVRHNGQHGRLEMSEGDPP